MNIEHVALWASNIDKLKDFYLKYFNCKVNNKYENKKKQFSSYFISFENGCRIEIMNRKDIVTTNADEHLGYAHIAISLANKNDVNVLTETLRNDGFIIAGEPRTTGDGYYESVILDPEGNKIELLASGASDVQLATESDLDEILYLQKCCYLSEAEIHQNYNIQPITQNLEETIEDFNKGKILKIVNGGRIIGSVRAYEENGTCFIGKLIVSRFYQHKGLGKLLMFAIEKEYSHLKRYELFTSNKSEKNLFVYTQLGYKVFKEIKQGSLNMVFLEKIIS